MKKLATIAFAVLATSAFANPPGPGPSPSAGPSISINNTSTQSAAMIFSAVRNKAEGGSGAVAVQNLASNAGNVAINAASSQFVGGLLSDVSNHANGTNAYASQSLASNMGRVTVGGTSHQSVYMLGAYVANSAAANAKAVQNIASNNGCVTCNE